MSECLFTYNDKRVEYGDFGDDEISPPTDIVIRDIDEIGDYLEEVTDKVWLMRCCDITNRIPAHETSRGAMERIFNTYDDIPKRGYDTWECGYLNGIMGALRWVLGDEKNYLDT